MKQICYPVITFVLSLLSLQAPPAMAGPGADMIASTARYEFHSNIWLNLHHYLYNIARDYPGEALGEHLRTAGMSAAEAEEIESAAGYYRENLVDKSLLFDQKMFALKRRLIGTGALEELQFESDSELEAHLRRAKPVYETHVWPAHRRANMQVLEDNLEHIERIENSVMDRIEELAQCRWSDQKIRVDLTYFANWAGAYTTVDPLVHAVIRSRGWASDLDWLEILFHEPTHALIQPDYGTVADTIERVSTRMNVKPGRNLWHGILFYLAGTAFQESLAAEGVEYQLFMFRNDVFSRYHAVLRRHLPAYVEGEATLEEAIELMLADSDR